MRTHEAKQGAYLYLAETHGSERVDKTRNKTQVKHIRNGQVIEQEGNQRQE